MNLSNKQKRALEKITGKPWNIWHPEAVEAFFAFTDKGDSSAMDDILGKGWKSYCPPIWEGTATKLQKNLLNLFFFHTAHAFTVKYWKEDFTKGLLFLWDFFLPQPDYEKWEAEGYPEVIPTFMYPDSYIKHAFEVYKEARGYIPIDDVSGCREWAEKLGIET